MFFNLYAQDTWFNFHNIPYANYKTSTTCSIDNKTYIEWFKTPGNV